MRRIAAAFVPLAVLAGAAAVGFAQDAVRGPAGDTITLVEDGVKKTLSGVTVESAAFDQVAYTQGGRRANVDGAYVVETRWGDVPREFAAAAAAMRAGDAASAAVGFDAALRKRGTTRGWLVEEANVELGDAWLVLARRDPASASNAARAYSAARDANPKSLLLDRILGGLARAEILAGRFDAAVAAAADLDAAARAARRPAWEAEAALLRGRALDEKGDTANAIVAFDQAVLRASSRATAAAKDVDLARRLRRVEVQASARKLRLLVVDAERGGTPQCAETARKFAEGLAARWPDDDEVAAATANAAGALHLAAGDARRALRKFQETEVLHFDLMEEAALALRYQALCFERLGDGSRRAEAQRSLAETYPGTEAARRAR
jgi:tetratricopeptide (TPR) repeat protein